MEERFCQNCGSRLDEKMGLCPICDAKALNKLEASNKEQKNKNILLIIIIALNALLILIGVIYFISRAIPFDNSKRNDSLQTTQPYVVTQKDSSDEESTTNEVTSKAESNKEKTTVVVVVVTTPAPVIEPDYLFPSDTTLLTESYLDTKSNEEIDLIRNEIYARHGYIFKKEKYYNYFIQKDWYIPTEPDMDKAYNNFNRIEKKNIDILVKYQGLN